MNSLKVCLNLGLNQSRNSDKKIGGDPRSHIYKKVHWVTSRATIRVGNGWRMCLGFHMTENVGPCRKRHRQLSLWVGQKLSCYVLNRQPRCLDPSEMPRHWGNMLTRKPQKQQCTNTSVGLYEVQEEKCNWKSYKTFRKSSSDREVTTEACFFFYDSKSKLEVNPGNIDKSRNISRKELDSKHRPRSLWLICFWCSHA